MRIYYFGELIADTQNKKTTPPTPKKKRVQITIQDVFVNETYKQKPHLSVRNWANA